MPPIVVDVVNDHRQALLRRDAQQMAEQARRWLGVEQAIQAQVDTLALQMAEDNITTMGRLSRSMRYRALREQLTHEMAKYVDYLEPNIVEGQRNAAALAITHGQQAVGAIATENQIHVPFNRLPVSAVEHYVGLAGDGSPVRAILAEASRVGPEALAQHLVNGIALGRAPLQTARLAVRQGLGQSYTRMASISRTEQLRVYRLVSLDNYEQSQVVRGYKRLSARDRRTCIGCLFADGREYPLGHGFDEHVQGRCTLVPVLYAVPAAVYPSGQDWFRQQSDGVQREMLGPSRFELWRRGEVSLDDMIARDWSDTWGGSIRPASVQALRSGQAEGVPFVSLPSAAGSPAPVSAATPTPVARAAAAGVPAPEPVLAVEQQIRTQDIEHLYAFRQDGSIIGHVTGTQTDVEALGDVADAIITHNHPADPTRWAYAPSFSVQDVHMALDQAVAEVRAVSQEYTYVMRFNPAIRGDRRWANQFEELISPMRSDVGEELRDAGMDRLHVAAEREHIVWTRLSGQTEGMIEYVRAPAQ